VSLSDIDFGKLCIQFREKLGAPFIERLERRISQDFDEALEKRPKDLFIGILQELHLYYVGPHEMVLDISDYMAVTYEISDFSLAFSEGHKYPASEKIEEAKKIVNAFYDMTEAIGLSDFVKKSTRWWQNEF
jgi:hypothetical protein